MTYEEPITADCEIVKDMRQLPALVTAHQQSVAAFFDKAVNALANACDAITALEIHDNARLLEDLSRVANDPTAEIKAGEARLRAQRALGQMILTVSSRGGFSKGGRPKAGFDKTRLSLADAGIDKNLANKARRAAKPTKEEFEGTMVPMIARKVWARHEPKPRSRDASPTVKARQVEKGPVLQRFDDHTSHVLKYLAERKCKTGAEKQLRMSADYLRSTIKRITDWLDANVPAADT